jgi:hypothetical protein
VAVQRIRYQGSISLVRELVSLLNEQANVHVCWTPSYMRADDVPHVTVGTNFVVTAEGPDAAINAAIWAFRDRFGSEAEGALDGPFVGEPAPA